MPDIKAIGFDLFNTLIIVEPDTLKDAMDRMVKSLQENRIAIEYEPFKKSYRDAALKYVQQARKDGKETHNSIWISVALNENGSSIPPDDARIGTAIDHYFSAFYNNCHTLPGTIGMLNKMKGRYPLGLLSNFTHGPAARKILDHTGLTPYFDAIIISGELGYRKPHPKVFKKLVEQLGTDSNEIIFIGDDPEPDIYGAWRSGLKPVWITYTRDNNIPVLRGVLHSDLEKPDLDVPSISSWQDLYSLLGIP